VQRHPERAPRLSLVKRDGRLVGFSAPRLVGSLCRALEAVGRHEPGLAGDLARVVEGSLLRRGASRPVTAEDVAVLAREVLVSAGCEPAANAYRAVADQRQLARAAMRIVGGGGPAARGIPPACSPLASADPEAWSKGRVVALLAAESELSELEAVEVAAGVERALFASGLTSVSAGLLREWIDNELRLRGLPARAGRSGCVGLAGHELRELLGGGADAEGRASSRLLERYAWAEVFTADTRLAHEEGLLSLEDLAGAGRVDALALGAWTLPVSGTGLTRRAQLRALGPLLRNLRHLAVREVLALWDGPALTADAAADLLASLAEPPSTAGRAAPLVLCLPAERPGLAAPVLAALERLRPLARRGLQLPGVRLPAAGLDDAVLEQAVALEGVDGRVQFGASDPQPLLVGASVAINLARVALRCGPRRVAAFLDGAEHLAALALSALAAQQALMPPAADAVRAATGLPDARLPRQRRLALCGFDTAAELLLGRDARGRAERAELAAALGLALRRALAASDGGLRLGRASEATRDRLGRLDLAAHPEVRDRLRLARHREGFRHDGAELLPSGADAEDAGAEAARIVRLLGLDDDAVVPRCTGGTAERLAYLRGYLSVISPVPDLHPCG